MDKEFSKKIPGIVSAFTWYLLQWRQKVAYLIEPDKVKEATAIYKKQNDIYRQFIEENIIDTRNPQDTLVLTEMYASFKEWFKEGFPNNTLPIKNEVREYFEKLWGELGAGFKWEGYRLRTIKDDIENGNAIVLENDDLVNYFEDGVALPPM